MERYKVPFGYSSLWPWLGSYFECHMEGNIISFWSGEEDTELPEPVIDSSGHHITSKLGPDLGHWNCKSWETFYLLAL